MRAIRRIFCVPALCILLSQSVSVALSQTTTATLSGVVVDDTNGVVPGVKVTLINNATALRRETMTNAEGYFTLPLVPPGTYTLRTTSDGFAPAEFTSVVLNVNDQVALQIRLKLGQVTQEVAVTDQSPLVNTSDASVSTVVDRQFVENIPLNGRSFQNLIALTPGVVISPSAETGDQGQISVAGQRAGSNYFTIDGVSANFAAPQTRYAAQSSNGGLFAFSALGSTNSLVSIDALQEFRLETSTYAPEFGRTSGSQSVLVTRSGTNSFHGSAFDYFRNDVLDANDWFANSTGQPKPRERQNDFGGVFSGPIQKDKTFFFFSYEGLRAVQPQFRFVDVPSLSARENAAPNVKALIDGFPLPNGPST